MAGFLKYSTPCKRNVRIRCAVDVRVRRPCAKLLINVNVHAPSTMISRLSVRLHEKKSIQCSKPVLKVSLDCGERNPSSCDSLTQLEHALLGVRFDNTRKVHPAGIEVESHRGLTIRLRDPELQQQPHAEESDLPST